MPRWIAAVAKARLHVALVALVACRATDSGAPDAGAHWLGSAPIPFTPGNASQLNGATVPAAGSLTTGQVLRATGPSALGYGAVDLSSAAAVANVLPTGNGGWPGAGSTPSSWTTTDWYIDPGNSTGCASDANNGTSATCGGTGVGPLLTYQELNVHRWGCFGNPTACPRLRQSTTVTFLSSQPDNTDPIYLTPALETGGLILQGSATTVSHTLGTVTAKNRTTPQLLQADLGAAVAAGTSIHNKTHNSYAWTYNTISGNTSALTQPLAPITVPVVLPSPTEVDTWTVGDSIDVVTWPVVNVVMALPTFSDYSGALTNGLFLYHLALSSTVDSFPATMLVGDSASIIECSSVREIAFANRYTLPAAPNSINVYAAAGYESNRNSIVSNTRVFGGSFGARGGGQTTNGMGNFLLDYDIIMAGTANQYILQGNLGLVYIDTGTTLVTGISETQALPVNNVSGSAIIWGPGTLNAVQHFNYASGAGAAASTFKVANLKTGGQTKACLLVPSAASSFATCNISVTAANLDTNLGTTIGCLSVGSAGEFCNF